jgi:hypothetical protein
MQSMGVVARARSATARPGPVRTAWAWAGVTAAAAAVLMFCYLRIAGATQVNSDGAGLELEAWNVLHGNVLLHGWWATDVSFYTTELPEYTAVTAFAGVRPEVVHICSALTYTLLVLLAAFVARGRARGTEGAARALLAAAVMLAPQAAGPTQVLLGSPDHVGTGAPVLVLLLLLDRAPARDGRPRWYVPVLAGALLAWAIVGDPLIEVVGVAPLFLACLTRAVRRLRAARPERSTWSLRSAWTTAWTTAGYELSLAAAAVAAVPVAAAASRLLVALGGFHTAKAWYGLLTAHQVAHGLGLAGESAFALFGADFHAVHGAGNVAFALLHLSGLALVLAAVILAAWRLLRPDGDGDLVADILVLAIAANFAAFVIDVPKPNIYAAHEIGPLLSIGAALTGRLLGGPLSARPPEAGSRWRRGLPAGLAAVLACYAVLLGIAAAHPQAAPRNVSLAAWLERHNLRSGLAPYWEAASVTVDTGQAVKMLSVAQSGWHGQLAPRKWQADVRVPSPGQDSANFVIVSPAEDVHLSRALAAFGKPAASYQYGPFTILVYRQNLLPELARSAAGPVKGTVSVAGGG